MWEGGFEGKSIGNIGIGNLRGDCRVGMWEGEFEGKTIGIIRIGTLRGNCRVCGRVNLKANL